MFVSPSKSLTRDVGLGLRLTGSESDSDSESESDRDLQVQSSESESSLEVPSVCRVFIFKAPGSSPLRGYSACATRSRSPRVTVEPEGIHRKSPGALMSFTY